MTSIERSALVRYPAAAMFDLVNDVAVYPQYLEGCVGAEIISQSDTEMIARLSLRKGGVGQVFTTRNRLNRPRSIAMELEEGPFSHLRGEWQFRALSERACKVSLQLEFEFKSAALSVAASRLFAQVANNLVDSLCRRAAQVYGNSLPDGGADA